MIDFHTHILPGMDDGSQSVAESVALLRMEKAQGVEAVVLTPHFYAQENSPEAFLIRRERAWRILEPNLDDGMPKVFLGAEVQYFEGIRGAEEIHRLRIEGTKFLLLEMPFSRWSERMVEDAAELNDRDDITLVLAHAERYMAMQNSQVWSYLRKRGVWIQSNISFFENWRTRRKAMSMLENGKIQLLGSDCHDLKTRCPNWNRLPQKAKQLARQSGAYNAFREMTRE